MSFRDLRNFTEMMRVLGYPRMISLTNFRQPNFPLVAEILVWLIKRFDAEATISGEHNTEQDRVALIRFVAEFMAKTANVKLNTKKLYQADGYAVQELLKITTLLYQAQIKSKENPSYAESRNVVKFDISDKINDLKSTRQLASQLTINGATLFDLLGREVELREIRNSKASRQFDTSEIEVALKEVIESTRKEIEETKHQTENVKETEENLETRIERRKNELDRNQKRLQTLKKVRPAFMDEFEKVEIELKALYDEYLQKFRYLAYLEHLYEDAAKVEQERFERRQAATKKQFEQMNNDDVSFDGILESKDSILPSNIQNPLSIGELEKKTEKTMQETRKSARINLVPQRRIYGSMSGRQRGTIRESSSMESFDSDSDLLIGDDSDDDDDDDDLNSLTIPGAEKFEKKPVEEKRSVSKIDNSDDDF